jgi:hypothetical protein
MNTNPDTDDFYKCKFFDCGDPEVLSHTEVHDALAEHFEASWLTDETLPQQAERLGAVTVKGFNPKPLDMEWLQAEAIDFVERFEDSFYEEFGGEDPEDNPPWEPENRAGVERAFFNVLKSATKNCTVWRCEEAASREFSPEECLEILK